MEEPEAPTEHLQEEIHHHAEHLGQRWIMGVALSSAILASLAAVASLSSGHTSNEAMICQIEAANQWSYFQSKSIKEAQLKSKVDILDALGKPALEPDKNKLAEYQKEKETIQQKAEEFEKKAKHYLSLHHVLARSVTMFQIAIAIGAISVLTRRRAYWLVSLSFGLVGLGFVIQSFITMLRH